MKYAFPTEDEPLRPWFEPLHLVAATIAGDRLFRFFDCDDFMCMGRVVRSRRPDITLYKHRYTRRYLNLDASSRAYRYHPPRQDSSGRGSYREHRRLRDALFQLGLRDLPWMKPGLEAERGGLSWDERWDLHPDPTEELWEPAPAEGARGGRRGHLRVV